jgi:dethiobiotin synthetase
MTNAYFVTATGTDIGKTFVTCLLVRYFRIKLQQVRACKPVMSGVGADLLATDAAALLRALGEEVNADTVSALSPWQFLAPLSPHRASALEGKHLSLDALVAWCDGWITTHQSATRFIEGVGGVMVPLNDTATTLDWMAQLGVPALLVTGDYLGTLSHSLTALACLKAAGVAVRGVIVNQSEISVEHAEVIRTLRRMTGDAIPIVSLPRTPAWRESDEAVKAVMQREDFQDFFSFAASLMLN